MQLEPYDFTYAGHTYILKRLNPKENLPKSLSSFDLFRINPNVRFLYEDELTTIFYEFIDKLKKYDYYQIVDKLKEDIKLLNSISEKLNNKLYVTPVRHTYLYRPFIIIAVGKKHKEYLFGEESKFKLLKRLSKDYPIEYKGLCFIRYDIIKKELI